MNAIAMAMIIFLGSIYLIVGRLSVRDQAMKYYPFLVIVLILSFVGFGPAHYVSYPSAQERSKLQEFLEISKIIKSHTKEPDAVLMVPLVNLPYLETTVDRGSVLQLPKAAFVYMAPELLAPMNEALKDSGY